MEWCQETTDSPNSQSEFFISIFLMTEILSNEPLKVIGVTFASWSLNVVIKSG